MVDTGLYTTLRITYFRRAKIKGCVTGNFSQNSVYPGIHTYCTRAAFSTFNATPGGQNSDFENQTSELMDFDLTLTNFFGFSTDVSGTGFVDYPIKDNISINKDATAKLTFLIDVNRMLRFYNQGRTDGGALPSMPSTSSYFFTSVFNNSGFAFVGAPGSISGYSFVTNACSGATTIPADHVCTSNGFIVAGWLTMASAADGSPLLANFQPDDDNTLTVIKGSNVGMSGPDPSLITMNANSTLTIKYIINHLANGEEGIGTVSNFNPNIAVGDSDTNAYFEGFQNSFGTLVFKRGL